MQTMPAPAADPIADRIRPLGTVTLFEMMEQLNKPGLSREEITVSLRIEWELDARIDWSDFTAEMIDAIPVDDTTALIEFYRSHVPGAPAAS